MEMQFITPLIKAALACSNFFFFLLYSASGSLKKAGRGSLASSFNVSLTDSIKKKKKAPTTILLSPSVRHQGPEQTSWQCHCLLASLMLSVFPEPFPSPQSAFQACRFRKRCPESEQLRSFFGMRLAKFEVMRAESCQAKVSRWLETFVTFVSLLDCESLLW